MSEIDYSPKCSPQIKKQIIELFKEGKTLTQVAEIIDVRVGTIIDWRFEDPIFGAEVARAQNLGYEAQADSLLTIADTYEDVNKARLQSDNTKWILARRARDVYGDKLDVSLTGSIDITGALTEAKGRALRPVHDLNNAVLPQPIDTTHQSLNEARGSKPLNDMIDIELDPIEKASDDDDMFK